jgi:uncharacterized SAM-binding protein YcdF (DUF218 family)
MKYRISFLLAVSIIIVLYIAGCRNVGKWLVKSDKNVKGDAMVVLVGSISDRVLQAADLYQEGLADKIIMVETGKTENDKILEERGTFILSKTGQSLKAEISLGIPADSIIVLGSGASSTQMEASVIRDYVIQTPNIDTLILVTSSFHTRRASMIFKSAFRKAGREVYISTSASKYSSFTGDEWWNSKEGIETVLLELLKISNFILFEQSKL